MREREKGAAPLTPNVPHRTWRGRCSAAAQPQVVPRGARPRSGTRGHRNMQHQAQACAANRQIQRTQRAHRKHTASTPQAHRRHTAGTLHLRLHCKGNIDGEGGGKLLQQADDGGDGRDVGKGRSDVAVDLRAAVGRVVPGTRQHQFSSTQVTNDKTDVYSTATLSSTYSLPPSYTEMPREGIHKGTATRGGEAWIEPQGNTMQGNAMHSSTTQGMGGLCDVRVSHLGS